MQTPRALAFILLVTLLAITRAVADDQPGTSDTPGQPSTPAVPTPPSETPAQNLPTARTRVVIEGFTLQVDDRLFTAEHEALRLRALRFMESELSDITMVVAADRVERFRKVTIVLDLDHGKLGPMQYHPSAGWLRDNGYSPDLAKCVHLPRAKDVVTSRNIREQPWVILHELSHAYHDQVLGFDDPRIIAAYDNYKNSGRGDKTLLHNGKRVRHYALTNHKEFFAEMTEAYIGSNDFFPFNRAELKESEPEIYALMREIWDSPDPQGQAGSP
jgi:hypothetical protein